MSNSNLINYVKISPNSSNPRKSKIDTITIHHMAGNMSVETCGNVFSSSNRQASSNYGIGSDGRIGLYVEECNRAWTSSNPSNDHRAVTIEVANDEIGGDWHVSDLALSKLIDLCIDICKRNNIPKLNYTGDTTGNLTMHKWFTATNCPGTYLSSKFTHIAEEVNKQLLPTIENEKYDREYPETGKFICKVDSIDFYNEPNKSSKVTGTYLNEEYVHYDKIALTDRYVYISWISASTGIRRYMPVRPRGGKLLGTIS